MENRQQLRIRLRTKPKILYKFCAKQNFHYDDLCTGRIIDACDGGLLINGELPSCKLLKSLADESLFLGCNLLLGADTVKALARVRWAQSTPKLGKNNHDMGLEFVKITEPDLRKLQKFLIHEQIENSKKKTTLRYYENH